MDTGKLLRTIRDIQNDEGQFGFQGKFQNVTNYYNDNNYDGINSELQAIGGEIEKSLLAGYVLTDYQILESLGIEKHFGRGSLDSVNTILEQRAHEVRPQLEQFIASRQDYLNRLETLKSSLESFGMQPRVLEDNEYEIGFSLPKNYAELENLEQVIADIRKFLHALADAVDGQQPLEIKYVSNGSIQVFIHAGVILAQNFDVVLDYALKIYAVIKACQDLKKMYKNHKDKRRKQMDTLAQEECDENVDKLMEEMLKALRLDPSQQVSIKTLFRTMLQHLENGVASEVRTPTLPEPKDPGPEADQEQKKQYRAAKIQYDKNVEIQERNREVFILQQNNFYGATTALINTPDPEKKKK